VPISEVASLAESRLLVEFQIASVCEKNRKVCPASEQSAHHTADQATWTATATSGRFENSLISMRANSAVSHLDVSNLTSGPSIF
jgi:hypothetical protein